MSRFSIQPHCRILTSFPPVPRVSHLCHLRQTYALPLFLGNEQFWSDMFSALVTETDPEVLVTGCLDDHAG